MKETIRQLAAQLEQCPSAVIEVKNDWIEVQPASDSGFLVSFYDCGDELIVGYGGWHDHFTDRQKAVSCFLFGLTNECRLKVEYCGELEYRWTVQELRDGEWQVIDKTALLIFPFWRARKVRYFSNDFRLGETTS